MFINTLYYPNLVGGAERSLKYLAEGLVKEGHRVVVICSKNKGEGKMDIINGVKVYYIGSKNIYWPFEENNRPLYKKAGWYLLDSYNPFMAKEVEKILRKERPDVVNTNNLSSFSISVWQKVKEINIPLIHTLRDYYLLCPKSRMNKNGDNCDKQCFECKILSLQKYYKSKCVDVVVGISKYILQKHLDHNYFKKSKKNIVIYNSTDTGYSVKKVKSKHEQISLGYIGRLDSGKGIEYLLKVLKGMKKTNWNLTIAGTGDKEYIGYLKSKYRLSNVKYLGFVNPEQFYKSIDILVVPSLWQEPLGRVVIESYSYGIPVIASKRGGIPELIEENRTGFTYNPEQPQRLSQLITKFIYNPSLIREFSVKCYNKSKEYSHENMIDKYIETYQSVL